MSSNETELRDCFRSQEISKNLFLVLEELRWIKEAIKQAAKSGESTTTSDRAQST